MTTKLFLIWWLATGVFVVPILTILFKHAHDDFKRESRRLDKRERDLAQRRRALEERKLRVAEETRRIEARKAARAKAIRDGALYFLDEEVR